MEPDALFQGTWLSLLPGVAFIALGAILRIRPALLENILLAFSSQAPARGELLHLVRGLFFIGGSWLAIFTGQVFPYPHGQRPSFVLFLEMLLISLSAAALIVMILWIMIGRRLLLKDRPRPTA